MLFEDVHHLGWHNITLNGHERILPLLTRVDKTLQLQPLVKLFWLTDRWEKTRATQRVVTPLTCSPPLITRQALQRHRDQVQSWTEHLPKWAIHLSVYPQSNETAAVQCRFMLKWYYSRQFCCLLGWRGCMHIFPGVTQTILKLKLAGPKSDCGHQRNYDVTKASMKYS